MAYAPGFLHDVFISYACANDPHGTGIIGTVATLLTEKLAAEGLRGEGEGDEVDVFLDRRRLTHGADLTDQVLTEARCSAVFLAFHSPAYDASPWCRREAAEFSANYDGNRRNLDGRLFVASLDKRCLPTKSSAEALRSRLFVPFFYLNRDKQDFPFLPIHAEQDEPRNPVGHSLSEAVKMLASEIADTLRTMRKSPPARRIFLADTSPARSAQAEDIKSWLGQKQAMVLRASGGAEGWLEESRGLIRQADVFVDVQEAVPSPVALEQGRLADELQKRRVRWVPRGELGADAVLALPAGIEPIEEPLENFKAALLQRLGQRSAVFRPAAEAFKEALRADPAADPVGSALVLLVGAEKDKPHVAQVQRKLAEIGCGCDAFMAADRVAKPDKWKAQLKAQLALGPAGVVFVDGDCDASWADQRRRDLFKFLLPDVAPGARAALCVFPPPDKERFYHPPPALVTRLADTELDRLRDVLFAKRG